MWNSYQNRGSQKHAIFFKVRTFLKMVNNTAVYWMGSKLNKIQLLIYAVLHVFNITHCYGVFNITHCCTEP